MTLSDIRDWLKSLNAAEHYSIGRLDNRRERSLGVYDRAGRGEPVLALGGIERSSYGVRRVTLLHWNENARETEAAARALWERTAFAVREDLPSGGRIQFVRPAVPGPIPVGTDGGGVYEYQFDLDIYYRR